ncbi:MAG: type II toxin-antitoxin system RatA family toxin [Alphaproteobacteria bacterium]|nr:type II toxin-antitoxin system RatA family toxin [Alphaproteobacteria bacterium]
MYRIVADIERYPEFLPWVVALRVKSSDRVRERQVLLAEMAVGYGGLRERYTSRVVLDPQLRTIDVVQTDGPFRSLENHWKFESEAGGCRVHFSIAFEFRSRILGAVASRAFERVMLKMTDAFEARARALSSFPPSDNPL